MRKLTVNIKMYKQWGIIITALLFSLMSYQASAMNDTFTKAPFVIKIDTRGTSESLTGNPNETQLKPIQWGGLGTFGIDWENDGTIDTTYMFTSFSGFITKSHSYSTPGIKEIAFYGDGEVKFKINEARRQLISVEQWGDVTWESCFGMFQSSVNLMSIDEANSPVFSAAGVDCTAMFSGCKSLQVSSLENWDVSNVTKMNLMFSGSSFNGAIGSWDVSNVTVFAQMFQDNEVFNQDIGNWDVTGVNASSSMSFMFNGASAFDQNLGNWDISNISNLFGLLSSSGMSTENYDSTLAGWASFSSIPSGVSLGASGVTYCASQNARQILIDEYNWNISGDEKSCIIFPPVAVCKTVDADISDSCLPILPPAIDFYDDSTNPNPTEEDLTFSLVESGNTFDVGSHEINLIVTNSDNLSDTCQATLNVTASSLPNGFSEEDIGFQGIHGGSYYDYDACGASKSITIETGATMYDGASFDDLATVTRYRCNLDNFTVVVRIDFVNDGFAGLILRASEDPSDPSAPTVGIFQGLGLWHQIHRRTTENTPVNISNVLAIAPTATGWVRIQKEGNYIRCASTSDNLVSDDLWWDLGAPVYFPYDCFHFGVATYAQNILQPVTSQLSNFRFYQDSNGALSEAPLSNFNIPENHPAPKAVLVPNPAINQVQVQLSTPLEGPAVISIMNQLGQPLVIQHAREGDMTVNLLLNKLPAGMYYVNLNTGSQMINLPLIKQ